MKRGAVLAIAIAALGAPACGGKKDDQPAATGSASAPAPAGGADAGSADAGSAAAGSAAAPAAEVDVPTEVDFETDAAAKIDEKNLEAQLKAVEQELAQ